jgi:hypothetical protein
VYLLFWDDVDLDVCADVLFWIQAYNLFSKYALFCCTTNGKFCTARFTGMQQKTSQTGGFSQAAFLVYGPMVKVSGALDDFSVNIDSLFCDVCNHFNILT